MAFGSGIGVHGRGLEELGNCCALAATTTLQMVMLLYYAVAITIVYCKAAGGGGEEVSNPMDYVKLDMGDGELVSASVVSF